MYDFIFLSVLLQYVGLNTSFKSMINDQSCFSHPSLNWKALPSTFVSSVDLLSRTSLSLMKSVNSTDP